MPTSSRYTGFFTVNFLEMIDGTYQLIDTVTQRNLFRALPGEL